MKEILVNYEHKVGKSKAGVDYDFFVLKMPVVLNGKTIYIDLTTKDETARNLLALYLSIKDSETKK